MRAILNRNWIEIALENKRTIGAILCKVLNIGGQLIIIPLVYGKLNSFEFGVFVTINTIMIFSLNIDFGIINAIKNPLHNALQKGNKSQASLIASTAFCFILIISAILLGFTCILYALNLDRYFFGEAKYEVLRFVVFISTVYFLIRFSFQIVHGFNHSLNRYFLNDVLMMFGTVITLFLMYLQSSLGKLTLENTIHLYFFPSCVVYILYFFYFIYIESKFSIRFGFFNASFLSDLLKTSAVFFFLQICWIFLTNFIPIILAKEVNMTIAGDYNIVARIFNFLYVINFITLNNNWHEIHAAHSQENVGKIKFMFNKISTISIGYSIACVVIALCSKQILYLWIGNKIDVSYNIIFLTCFYFIGIIYLSCINIFMNCLNYFKIQIWLSIINVILIPLIYLYMKYDTVIQREILIMGTPLLLIYINIVVSMIALNRKLKMAF